MRPRVEVYPKYESNTYHLQYVPLSRQSFKHVGRFGALGSPEIEIVHFRKKSLSTKIVFLFDLISLHMKFFGVLDHHCKVKD